MSSHDFDRGMDISARQTGLSILKIADLLGFSLIIQSLKLFTQNGVKI